MRDLIRGAAWLGGEPEAHVFGNPCGGARPRRAGCGPRRLVVLSAPVLLVL